MALRVSSRPVTSAGSSRRGYFALDRWLNSISSTETIGSVGQATAYNVDENGDATTVASEVTITGEAETAEDLEMFNRTVAAGDAIQFDYSGQLAGTNYLIRVSVTSTPGNQTETWDLPLVVAD